MRGGRLEEALGARASGQQTSLGIEAEGWGGVSYSAQGDEWNWKHFLALPRKPSSEPKGQHA